MSRPASLYKYMPNPKSFLENGMFRFTQPADLDDLEEAIPGLSLNDHAPEDYEVARHELAISGIHDVDDDPVRRLMRPFPAARFDPQDFPGINRPVPELRNKPFETLAEYDEALSGKAVEECIKFANQHYGILSLSDAARQESMWVHYANQHKGIVVRFDCTHAFFSKDLFPVRYIDSPISVSIVEGMLRLGGIRLGKDDILRGTISSVSDELFVRKRKDWAYQHEWRMFKRLANCNEKLNNSERGGLPVCLFKIPPAAIKGMVFGLKAEEEWKITILQMLKAKREWAHLELKERSRSIYGVEEIPIKGV